MEDRHFMEGKGLTDEEIAQQNRKTVVDEFERIYEQNDAVAYLAVLAARKRLKLAESYQDENPDGKMDEHIDIDERIGSIVHSLGIIRHLVIQLQDDGSLNRKDAAGMTREAARIAGEALGLAEFAVDLEIKAAKRLKDKGTTWRSIREKRKK